MKLLKKQLRDRTEREISAYFEGVRAGLFFCSWVEKNERFVGKTPSRLKDVKNLVSKLEYEALKFKKDILDAWRKKNESD